MRQKTLLRLAFGLAASLALVLLTFPALAAVELVFFDARTETDRVRLDWETATELNNAGFQVRRSTSPAIGAENFQVIDVLDPDTNQAVSFIPAQGDSIIGAEYTFYDENVTYGTRYYYYLEDIDTSNVSAFHGDAFGNPIEVVAGQTPTPTITPSPTRTSPPGTSTPTTTTTPQGTPVPTATRTPSRTPSRTPTRTPTRTRTPVPGFFASNTPVPSITPTPGPLTPSLTPTISPTPTETIPPFDQTLTAVYTQAAGLTTATVPPSRTPAPTVTITLSPTLQNTRTLTPTPQGILESAGLGAYSRFGLVLLLLCGAGLGLPLFIFFYLRRNREEE